MSVYQNLTGTTSKTFTLGKKGITLTNNEDGVLKVNAQLMLEKIFLDVNKVSYIDSLEYTGNAASATKFKNKISLKLSGGATGSVETDFSGETNINVTSLDSSKLSGNIAWERISSLVSPATSGSANKFNGKENVLARKDHDHEYMAKTNVGNIFSAGQTITKNSEGTSLKLTGTNDNNGILIEKTTEDGVVQTQTFIESRENSSIIGTKTETPIIFAVSEGTVLTIGTDMSIKTANDVSANSNDNQVATTKWVNDKKFASENHNHNKDYVSSVVKSSTSSDTIVVTKNNSPVSFAIDNVAHATNISGGEANQILVQQGKDTTTFIVAPASKGNHLLQSKDGIFSWINEGSVTASSATNANYAGALGTVSQNYTYTTLNTKLTDLDGSITSLQTSINTLDKAAIKSIGLNGKSYSGNKVELPNLALETHTHVIDDINNLQTTLDGKANSSHTHVIDDINNLQTTLDGKASTKSVSDLETSLTTKINGKANSSHTHVTGDITGLDTKLTNIDNSIASINTTLDGKASTAVATSTKNGLMSSTNFTKLAGIADGATKVEKSSNGKILINDVDTTIYTLPTASSTSYGGVMVDSSLSDTSANPVENKVINEAISSINSKFSGNQSFENVTVRGNLNVQGSTTTINATNLTIKDKLIELYKRDNPVSITDFAGLYVDKYDGNNSGALVFDSTGTAYVGDVTISDNAITSSTSLQPLATRDKGLNNDDVLKWDSTKNTLVKATNLKDESYVPITRTIAGLSLNANIDVADLQNSLKLGSAAYQASTAFLASNGKAVSATTADKLGTNAGSTSQPVYFSEGIPVAITGALSNDITGNASTATKASKVTVSSLNSGTGYIIVGSSTTGDIAPKAVEGIIVDYSSKTISAPEYIINAKIEGEIDGTASKAVFATSAGYASKVTVSSTDTAKDYNLTFVEGVSGSNQIYVANTNTIKINPSTKKINASTYTITASKFDGTASKADSLANGAKNQLVYQSAANTTTFIEAPGEDKDILVYDSTSTTIKWGKSAELNVNSAKQSETLNINTKQANKTYLIGTLEATGTGRKVYNTYGSITAGELSLGDIDNKGSISLVNSSTTSKILPGSSSANLTLPNSNGTLDTVEARNTALGNKVSKAGDTMTGGLEIVNANSQLKIASASTANTAKLATIETYDYAGKVKTIFQGNEETTSSTLHIGGNATGSNNYSNIKLYSGENVVLEIKSDSISVKNKVLPTASDTVDLGSSTLEFNNLYAKNIYENGVSLNKKYAYTASKSGTGAYVTSIGVSNGVVTYYTGNPANTDTKVTQTNVTTSYRPIIVSSLGASTATLAHGLTSASTAGVGYFKEIVAGPNGDLYATKFVGAFEGSLNGNASTATSVNTLDMASNTNSYLFVGTSTAGNQSPRFVNDIFVNRTVDASGNITSRTLNANGYTIIGTTFSGTFSGNASSASKVNTTNIGTDDIEYGILVNNGTGNISPIKSGVTINPKQKTISAPSGYTISAETFSGKASTAGTADKAIKLNSAAGNSTQPVYVDTDGSVKACGDELAVDITGTAGKAKAFTSSYGSASKPIYIKSDGTPAECSGTLDLNAKTASVATKAANLSNGALGQIPYQTSANATSFLGSWFGTSETTAGVSRTLILAKGATIPTWQTEPYLRLTGGTLTGKLTLAANKTTDSYTSDAFNGNNSNLTNIHGIYIGNATKTAANAYANGINFYKSSTNTNTLYVGADDELYYTQDRKLGSAPAAADVFKVITNKNLSTALSEDLLSKSNFATFASTFSVDSFKGTLSVSKGGTGATTLANNQILLGNGTGAIKTIAAIPTTDPTDAAHDSSNYYLKSTADKKGYTWGKLGTIVSKNAGDYLGANATAKNSEKVNLNIRTSTNETQEYSIIFGDAVSANASSNLYVKPANTATNDKKFTYNVNTGNVTAAKFTGTLEGNASSATVATSAGYASKVTVSSTDTAKDYNLTFVEKVSGSNQVYVAGSNPIKVNPSTKKINATGYEITASKVSATTFTGTLAGNAESASKVNITDIGTSDTEYGILVHNASGNQTPIKSDITINPNTNIIDASKYTIKAKIGGNYTVDGNLTITENVNISQNLNVTGTATIGGLTVKGSTTSIISNELKVKDQLIELAAGRTETTAITNYAGMFIQNYDGTNTGALVFDANGTAYVGDVTYDSSQGIIVPKTPDTGSSKTSLQPLATRDSNLANDDVLKWDSSKNTLVKATNLIDTAYVPKDVTTKAITGAVKVNVNDNGLVIGSSSLVASDIPDISETYLPLANKGVKTVAGSVSFTNDVKIYNTNSGTHGLHIYRNGTTSSSEYVKQYLTDDAFCVSYTNDEATSSIKFIMENTDTESPNAGTNKTTGNVTFTALASNKSRVTATEFSGNLTGKATSAGTADTATNANNIKVTVSNSGNFYIPVISPTSETENKAVYVTSSKPILISIPSTGTPVINASGYTVSATTFSGALSGNASTATSATNATNVDLSATPTRSEANGDSFEIKAGNGTAATIDIQNAKKAGSIVTTSATGNSSRHVFFAYEGNDSKVVYNDSFKFNPSTQVLNIGSVTINGKSSTVTASTFTGNLNGNAKTATEANNAGYLRTNVTVPSLNVSGFYANEDDKTLTMYKGTTSSEEIIGQIKFGANPGSTTIKVANASATVITNTNIASHAVTDVIVKNGATGSVTGTKSNGTVTVDIASIIPSASSLAGDFVTINSDQNVPSKKSFGQGITLGTNATANSTTYSNSGCTMKYNSTKKCVQFIFA